ncbi:MAG: hypothetical protein IPL53_22045 [Ignavibacteria bacterium]|nr:hypothetical protein [Ignavibacteria bacterium]
MPTVEYWAIPGFGNFWFYPSSQEQYGPSRSYQMGFGLYPGEERQILRKYLMFTDREMN